MRLTTRGRYALRASLALAKLRKEGRPVSINQLSEQEHISPVFLEQIFFKLRKAGIVVSMRGPGGGFNFTKPLNELSVFEILSAAGEDLGNSLCDKHNDQCERTGDCLSHSVFIDLAEMVRCYFTKMTLASIMDKYNESTTGSGNDNIGNVILEV